MQRLIPILFLLFVFAPNDYVFGTNKHGISVSLSPDNRTEIAANMRQARHYMEKGDYLAAKRKLERVLELDKDHAEAKALLLQCEQKIEAQRAAELEELNSAVESGTEQALRDFVEHHPDGYFLEQAEKYLQDFHLWTSARQKATKDAYLEYLSTSTIQGYKKEAEMAIKTIEAEAAWAICKRSMTQERLEMFIEEYEETPFENEARYELNLMQAERFYKSGLHNSAIKFYEDANNIHALTGKPLKHYRELVTEQHFNQVKASNSASDLKDFLSRTSSDSPYYDPISNRLAMVLANNLTISSTEQDFKEALKYAKDDSVRASVSQTIDSIKMRQRDQRSQNRREERKKRWKGKTSWGWSVCNLYYGNDALEIETGLRVKFGQPDQLINVLVGSDIQFFMVPYYEQEYFHGYSYSSRRTDFEVKLAIPASVILNLGKVTYLGLGVVLYPNVASTQSPFVAIEPHVGFTGFLGDFSIHLRQMTNPYGISDKGKINMMVGYQWVFGF